MVLKQKRENTDVLIVDASKGFIKEGKNNKLRASDIKRIADTVTRRISVPKLSRVVSREEIRSNEYNLNIPRYVDSSESAESWDIYASMFGGIPKSEIDELSAFWSAFPNLKAALFTDDGTPYVTVAAADIKSAIKTNADVVSFENVYNTAFSDFAAFLKQKLIDEVSSVEINRAEAVISEDIFARLAGIPLIDGYEAYQLSDDERTRIAIDLEIIQTEGFAATKKVDPNLVLKKKDGKDQEVQEGWVGHIMPFELVQATLLRDEKAELSQMESRLAEIPSAYEEIADMLTEEEKEGDFYADDSFVDKECTKKLKELRTDRTPEAVQLKEKLNRVDKLMQEEKELKAQIKKADAALQAKTKTVIEGLSDEQVRMLLEKNGLTHSFQT